MKFISTAVLIYGSYALLLFLFQRAVIYPGRSITPPPSPPSGAGISQLWLESGFGRVEAWFLPGRGKNPARMPALLFFHGNGEIIDFLPEQMEGFRAMGMGVLLVGLGLKLATEKV